MTDTSKKQDSPKSSGFIKRSGITVGKQLIGPYLHATKTVSGSASRISISLQELYQRFRRPGTINKDDYAWSGAQTEQSAFQELFVANGWTEAELVTQRRAVRRTKYAMIAMAWIMFCVTVATTLFLSYQFLLFAIPAGLSMFIISGLRAFQYALFQTQLEERALFTFKQFLSRDDLFSRIFS